MTSRFLGDENTPKRIIETLRSAGFDVCWVVEDQRGASDADVANRAMRERRVLITHDADFPKLMHLGLVELPGLILLELPRLSSQQKALLVLNFILSNPEGGIGAIVVIEPARIRVRPINPRSPDR